MRREWSRWDSGKSHRIQDRRKGDVLKTAAVLLQRFV